MLLRSDDPCSSPRGRRGSSQGRLFERVLAAALTAAALAVAALTVATFAWWSLSGEVRASEGTGGADAGAPVHLMHVTGTIDLGLAPYVERAVERAEEDGAAALVVEIDTPGGRVDAVVQMRDAIVGAEIRTIALVDASAFSAGALVAIAADEIYMTPGAVMGAATPVLGGTGEVADEKTISAVRALFASTAEANGRDPRIAEAMVDTRVVVEGLVDDDELLTLTTAQALERGYADGRVTVSTTSSPGWGWTSGRSSTPSPASPSDSSGSSPTRPSPVCCCSVGCCS